MRGASAWDTDWGPPQEKMLDIVVGCDTECEPVLRTHVRQPRHKASITQCSSLILAFLKGVKPSE